MIFLGKKRAKKFARVKKILNFFQAGDKKSKITGKKKCCLSLKKVDS